MPDPVPFGAAARLGADFGASIDALPSRPAVEIRRPVAGEIIQVRDDEPAAVNCGEHRGQVTLLPGRPHPASRPKPRGRLLRVAVNSLGDVFLWPAPRGRMNDLIADAKQVWVRVAWDKKAAGYRYQAFPHPNPPRWPKESLAELISLACPSLYQQFLRERG